MKYPKFLQMLTLAAVVTTALPAAEIAALASEKETPKEYEARTDYTLPEGYHYVLSDGKYVTFADNGKAVVEKDEEKPTETSNAEPQKAEVKKEVQAPEKDTEASKEEKEPEESGDKDTDESSSSEGNETGSEAGGETDGSETDGESGSETGGETDGSEGDESEGDVTGGETDGSEGSESGGETGGETDGSEGSETGGETDGSEGDETGSETDGETAGDAENGTGTEGSIGAVDSEGSGNTYDVSVPEDKEKSYTLPKPQEMKVQQNLSFKASRPFTAIGDRICYNVEVPIEGIPSFITQEMVVGALKAQDETGFPASVTIAQIIKESGYGKYGPGGENGQGLSYLAYQYCNLFGIKGTGTAGSAVMKTNEMTSDGTTYSIQAGFRVYNTYTECIEDRSRLLENAYSDLTANVTDANTFAMRIGGRWATGINYGQGLIKTMETYDLYRLDEMTLLDFNEMIGTFANPCPGSHITSSFGYRTFDGKFHKGLDMGTGSENIPTYAAEAGTVTFAGNAGDAGNLIIINHGNGLVTKYMHHSEMYVKIGQKVEKGQQIGLSGTTGHSTGNHLHFQVEQDGVAMNPAIYLSNEGMQARACD